MCSFTAGHTSVYISDEKLTPDVEYVF